MLPYIQIFGYNIPLYGVCITFGIVLAIVVVVLRSSSMGVKKEDTFYSCLLASLGLIIGGKLLYLITIVPSIASNWDTFWKWENIEAVIKGGYVFYGGFFGAVLMIFWYTRRYKIPTMKMFDCLAIGVPLAHAFGRIGCFCAGCCYGVPSKFGMMFNASEIAPHGVHLLPTQLIESGFNFLLFIVLLVLSFKKIKTGMLTAIYLLSYAIFRFVLEFFRYDFERGSFLLFSTSQWISLLIVPLGIFIIVKSLKKGFRT